MDQKNTIVKCKAYPDCLFNHNGVCDNYVINIGADGKCESYIETTTENNVLLEGNPLCYECNYFADSGLLQCPCDKHEQYVYRKAPVCSDFKAKRGQRAKCDFFDDMMDIDNKHLGEAVTIKMKIAELDKPNKNKSIIKPMSDHLCDIRCVSAHYAEDGELYCALIQNFPERPLRCSAYDDGGEE